MSSLCLYNRALSRNAPLGIDLDDIIQETMIKFHRLISKQNDVVVSPERLLRSIARYQIIDSVREKRRLAASRHAYLEARARLTAPSQEMETHDEAEVIIKKYFPMLRSDSRAMIENILSQGRSFRETAELLGIEVGAARVRYHRAIRQLRDLVIQGDHKLKRIQDNLSRLEERDRSILNLVLVQGVSPKDAALVLRVQPATFYKRYERALKRLESLQRESKD